MNNILICVDSYKESYSSKELNNTIKESLLKYNNDLCIDTQIIADGGEGTVDAFLDIGYEKIEIIAHDPLFRKIKCYYAFNSNIKHAVIEMAQASGIERLSDEEKNTILTSTYGTGELLKDAIINGAKEITIGIGSSATTDAGMGMAAALGVEFLNKKNEVLKPIGKNLQNITNINFTNIIDLTSVNIIVASDVTNILYGEKGAAHIYGKQKGATDDEILILDKGLKNLSDILNNGNENINGSGAAGGLGYGLLTFCYAKIKKGFEVISNYVELESKVKKCDVVITGEGKFDTQSLYGKLPVEVCELAKKYNKKCIGIFGIIEDTNVALDSKFDVVLSTTNKIDILENIKKDTLMNIELLCKNIIELGSYNE